MPIKYKIDVLDALKDKGITTYKIRSEKLLSESTVQALRQKKQISWDNIEKICRLLDCKIEDFLVYEKEE